MSTSFEVFPTKLNKPKCDEIIKYSIQLFNEYMKKEKILRDIEITVIEISDDNEVNMNPLSLVLKEDGCCTVFNLNEEGEVYVFYRELTEVDKDFWNEELQENKNAQFMKEKIDANLEIGYCWTVKRTMGQPIIVSLYYGYLAIAIAVLTDGIIYSDDGAWDYSCFPISASEFETEYLNIDKLNDKSIKQCIEHWLEKLNRNYSCF